MKRVMLLVGALMMFVAAMAVPAFAQDTGDRTAGGSGGPGGGGGGTCTWEGTVSNCSGGSGAGGNFDWDSDGDGVPDATVSGGGGAGGHLVYDSTNDNALFESRGVGGGGNDSGYYGGIPNGGFGQHCTGTTFDPECVGGGVEGL